MHCILWFSMIKIHSIEHLSRAPFECVCGTTCVCLCALSFVTKPYFYFCCFSFVHFCSFLPIWCMYNVHVEFSVDIRYSFPCRVPWVCSHIISIYVLCIRTRMKRPTLILMALWMERYWTLKQVLFLFFSFFSSPYSQPWNRSIKCTVVWHTKQYGLADDDNKIIDVDQYVSRMVVFLWWRRWAPLYLYGFPSELFKWKTFSLRT